MAAISGGTNYTTQAVDYLYDDLGRLTQEKHSHPLVPADDWRIDYTYDLVGNRLSKTRKLGITVMEQVFGEYNELDQLVAETVGVRTLPNDQNLATTNWQYDYDPNGALKLKNKTTDTIDRTDYTYDLQGRLLETVREYPATGGFGGNNLDRTRYAYNEQGVRAQSLFHDHRVFNNGTLTSTLYVINAQSPSGYAQSLEERTLPSNVTPPASSTASVAIVVATREAVPSTSYAYGLGVLEQRKGLAPDSVKYMLPDHQGSTQQLAEVAGGVLAYAGSTYHFDAYGNLVNANGSPYEGPQWTTKLYIGEEFDKPLGAYNLRRREYFPGLNRFMTTDPLEIVLTAPLTHHAYAYSFNNPGNFTDRSGQRPLTDIDLAIAETQLIAANLSKNEIRLRMLILGNVDSGRVTFGDSRNSEYWVESERRGAYVPVGSATEAIKSLWSTGGNAIACNKYSKLIILKSFIDMFVSFRQGRKILAAS